MDGSGRHAAGIEGHPLRGMGRSAGRRPAQPNLHTCCIVDCLPCYYSWPRVRGRGPFVYRGQAGAPIQIVIVSSELPTHVYVCKSATQPDLIKPSVPKNIRIRQRGSARVGPAEKEVQDRTHIPQRPRVGWPQPKYTLFGHARSPAGGDQTKTTFSWVREGEKGADSTGIGQEHKSTPQDWWESLLCVCLSDAVRWRGKV